MPINLFASQSCASITLAASALVLNISERDIMPIRTGVKSGIKSTHWLHATHSVAVFNIHKLFGQTLGRNSIMAPKANSGI